MSRLKKIIAEKCPNCEEGEVFISKGNLLQLKMPKMHHTCPKCQHKFEKEPGYFFGAMYVSYALVVAQGIFIYLLAQCFTNHPIYIISLIVLTAILLSNINYRYARIIWMYLFTKKQSTSSVQ